ncbi:hypothetical protein MMC18_007668 [Xylographa bjoerkii]|nr:hypothetical protein [Xylographa bjoerkii]
MLKDGLLARIPIAMSFEEAATLGVAINTIGQALYMSLKLPLPTSPAQTPLPVLIYGGSTAIGTIAIQYAKLSGLTVITTASPKNFELVKSYGADAFFDYHDPDCGEKIRTYTKNPLRYVLDCISQPPMPYQATIVRSSTSHALRYTSFGEGFTKFGHAFPPIKEHYDYTVMFWKMSEKLLAEGRIKTHPMIVDERGLQGIPDGINNLREGKVSATKLVYRTADTPGIGVFAELMG